MKDFNRDRGFPLSRRIPRARQHSFLMRIQQSMVEENHSADSQTVNIPQMALLHHRFC